MKTIQEINEKIRSGDAVVVTAEEMIEIVEDLGPKDAAEKVDVVTTGTFGAMCSSGVFLNFGHADPPIKMIKTYLNGVESYSGLAAVDTYLGATQPNTDDDIGIDYGGAHVIEDLVAGKEIELVAEGYTTDCYPRKKVTTTITIDDLNQAILVNPRNCYQSYNAATNSKEEKIYTYMGTLLPEYGNINYSGAGQLNPLQNDYNRETKTYNTIGIGTKIFLGGGIGYVVSEGTQHSPDNAFGTLMVSGDLKTMDSKYLRGATLPKYGSSLFVGMGIPIPVLNEDVAKACAVRDEDIYVSIIDYGVPRRERPIVGKVNYKELRSGCVDIEVEIEGKKVQKSVKTAPVSSYKVSREIAEELKDWILKGEFLLSERVATLGKGSARPMKAKAKLVGDILSKPPIVASSNISVEEASRIIIENNINHLPIVDENGVLTGIVTSWDIARAVSQNKKSIAEIMTKYVVSSTVDEPIDVVARKMAAHNISGVPVLDSNKRVLGIVTAEDLSKLIGRSNIVSKI
ncbi:MAG: L-aspartate semialdehyde sulfurtransferase [Methanothermococcus sp.]|uniref:homocysteine biosynthesis protein n=1 Tax=Methanothermococcus TaxID=155862 RepID=UPI00037F4061|nr:MULTISPECIES: homocysteine biosynthesis protein [Methanothermococcus]MDK2789833.1 L-aspartate semialdehyde sulfurtransferase [Methanothermococcus sp.]MDK2987960.1 L-aspartate semialdehyde sulfurtransferase [Methanothermococcus sp.]